MSEIHLLVKHFLFFPIFLVTGIALLEGGNPTIQHSIFTKLQNSEMSQAFFKVSGENV